MRGGEGGVRRGKTRFGSRGGDGVKGVVDATWELEVGAALGDPSEADGDGVFALGLHRAGAEGAPGASIKEQGDRVGFPALDLGFDA